MHTNGRESMRKLVNGRGERLAILSAHSDSSPSRPILLHTSARGVHASCKVVPPFDYGLRGCFYQAKG
jgi:hypothetical protein